MLELDLPELFQEPFVRPGQAWQAEWAQLK